MTRIYHTQEAFQVAKIAGRSMFESWLQMGSIKTQERYVTLRS